MSAVVEIVFVQDWDSEIEDGDNNAPEFGDLDAMVAYLSMWDYGTETDDAHTVAHSQHGSQDREYVTTYGGLEYTLYWDNALQYAGLERKPLA